VRVALDGLRERDRHLLLLHAEGYGYREMARVLGVRESSIGAFLARARRAFRAIYGEGTDAPR
jgi:DNA-directed RNA polymerase specialized sigma24 family protein